MRQDISKTDRYFDDKWESLMRFNQLKQFKAIIDYGSMNAAAKKLYVSQSAISQNLDKLEQELGIKFFDRLANGKLKLNSNGEKMLGYVEQILEIEQEILHAFQPQKPKKLIHIYSGGSRLLTALIANYVKSHHDISFHTSIGPRERGIQAILNKEIDLLIDDGYIDEPERFMNSGYERYISNQEIREAFCNRHNLKSVLFYQSKLYLCVPKNSPYSVYDKMSLKELESIPLINGNNTSDYSFWLEELMKYRNVNLNFIMAVDNDTFNSMIFQHGYNTLILSSFLLHDIRFRTQCKLILIDDPYAQREFYIYTRKDNDKANSFLQEALSNFDWDLLLYENSPHIT